MLHCISMKNRNESRQVKDILFFMESVGCDSGENPHAQLDLTGELGDLRAIMHECMVMVLPEHSISMCVLVSTQ